MAPGGYAVVSGIFMAFCIMPLLAPAWSEEVLTNDTIIQMVRGGLPESVVVAKIQSTPTRFDVRAEALLALKKAGVPDKVLEAMIAPAAQTPSRSSAQPPAPSSSVAGSAAPAAVPQSAAPPAVQLPPGVVVVPPTVLGAMQGRRTLGSVYHLNGQRQVELTPVGAEIQTHSNFFNGTRKQELVLPGRTAGYRITERQPVFLSPSPPSDMPLVRLDPGRNDRNLKFGSFSNTPFVGVTTQRGVRAADRIDVEAERDPSGLYRVRPRRPLEPGEYGFVSTFGMHGTTDGAVYDFGVDQ